jgi:uncharacterized membrane protein YgcG
MHHHSCLVNALPFVLPKNLAFSVPSQLLGALCCACRPTQDLASRLPLRRAHQQSGDGDDSGDSDEGDGASTGDGSRVGGGKVRKRH